MPKMYHTRQDAEHDMARLIGWPDCRVVRIEPVVPEEVEDGLYAIELTPHRQDRDMELPATYLGTDGYQE